MRKLLIPSVVEFHLKGRVVDEIAESLYHTVRNQGSRFVTDSKIENLVKANEYLDHQIKRLIKYAENNDFEKFDYLADKLLKRSQVFRVYALNHVYPNWTTMCLTKVMRILEKVEEYARTEVANLRYKRVWIDKKETGDYGRPLGVPYPADRIYGHQITRIMEALFHGKKYYRENQHGGRAKRGVLTFLKALSEKFEKNKRIYEFDIKGYFDHIDHDAMLNLVKESEVLHKYLKGALKSQPESYVLPPKEKDEATLKYERCLGYFIMKTEVSGPMNFSEKSWHGCDRFTGPTQSLVINRERGISVIHTNETIDALENYPSDMILEKFFKTTGDRKIFKLEETYKMLQEGRRLDTGIMNVFEQAPVTEEARAKGRDNWKDLGLANSGVPQGSSFGPVLASVLLGLVAPPDSELYMDDGIIYLGDKSPKESTMNKKLNKILHPIGCEINPDKSGILGVKTLATKGMKIIGLRLRRSIFTDTKITSETRKGITRDLLYFNAEGLEKKLSELLERKLITVSKSKVLKWYLKKGKLKEINSFGLDLAERIGIMGCLVSKAFSPTSTLEEMKVIIEEGIERAEMKLAQSTGSLGERVHGCVGKILLDLDNGERKWIMPILHNNRAICNNILLRYLKGERPGKQFRIQGLRKPWKKYPSKTGTTTNPKGPDG